MRQAKSPKAVAIEPSPFDIALTQPAPEEGAVMPLRVAESEAEGKSHRRRRVGIGTGCNFMNGIEGKSLLRQMLIDGA
jgi:hypothetical protein